MHSDLNSLIAVFEKMKANGWNTEDYLKWGFFFVDADKHKLESVYEELRSRNYTLVNLRLLKDQKWQLQASKKDKLTPQKLHQRNLAFNELAAYFEVELYDGWDVGKID
ncbi:ribonuclease E inhibitor RraB [Rhodocytophaga aerolata]|uniref:Ribonuclease E inhibitor RraB n=1 Tax=Rhodocytophaga aerolata TaxID=455078 RepID=A0ABT8RHI0_9BACT|nr:ribonuclease E inhibitor RraB [Rhodocytophaga aerolata]MDO1451562.1 ribonuclease E inhibitor RraB [Rhodocytophaga aerolata]